MGRSSPIQGDGVAAGEVENCNHEWIIDTPAGPSSQGICRQCGNKRDFMNYIEGSTWGYDVPLDHLAGGTRLPTDTNQQPNKNLSDDEES